MSEKNKGKLIKKELKRKMSKYTWYVREGGGSMSWAFNVYSSPEVKWGSGDHKKMMDILRKHERIDYDSHSGEILGGGNTYVQYNGTPYWK